MFRFTTDDDWLFYLNISFFKKKKHLTLRKKLYSMYVYNQSEKETHISDLDFMHLTCELRNLKNILTLQKLVTQFSF